MTLFAILTLFPEALEAYVRTSILKLAQDKGKVRIELVDFRDFTRDRHRSVDDRPFGGGPGMVLKPEPIVECVEWLERKYGGFKKILLCPSGTPFRQSAAEAYTCEPRLLILCGRYEGFDTRILSHLEFEEVSVGDFVLSGGELPALIIVEAVTRLIPGVLGDERSAEEDSFSDGGGLDHPHYTRPRVFRGEAVPQVLLSGNHAEIELWRAAQARRRTRERRPELLREPAAVKTPLHGTPPEHGGPRMRSNTAPASSPALRLDPGPQLDPAPRHQAERTRIPAPPTELAPPADPAWPPPHPPAR